MRLFGGNSEILFFGLWSRGRCRLLEVKSWERDDDDATIFREVALLAKCSAAVAESVDAQADSLGCSFGIVCVELSTSPDQAGQSDPESDFRILKRLIAYELVWNLHPSMGQVQVGLDEHWQIAGVLPA